jgi:hypothetical protein
MVNSLPLCYKCQVAEKNLILRINVKNEINVQFSLILILQER